MATFTITNNPTTVNFAGGVTGVPARGTTWRIAFGGTWVASDTYTFNLITASDTIVLGIGRVTKTVPVAALTLSDRVHFIAGFFWYGCDNDDPTAWEQQAAGAFSVNVAKKFKRPENLVSMSAYQGKMALFGRWSTSIFNLDPNPDNISLFQVLANIGSFAPIATESVGDLDTLFLGDTAFRSLRSQVTTLSAYVSDIGSPIDLIVQPVIKALSDSQKAASVGIVEPTSQRFWCYVGTKLYVLSNFPSSKITAWCTYDVQGLISATMQTLVPSKFVIYKGQVYMRCSFSGNEYVFLYGGTNNATYDATTATIAIPWFDIKNPATLKKAGSFDSAFTGEWKFFFGMDWQGGFDSTNAVADLNQSTFEQGAMPLIGDGYHFRFQVTSVGSTAAVFSSFVFHYTMANEKGSG